MKTLRWLVPIALAVMLLVIGGAVASATGVEPANPLYVDNAPHSIAPNTEVWYRFEYNGSHDQILVRLVNGKDNGIRFEVYTPTQIQEWWKNDGVGMGSAQGDDLVWSGNSNEKGTWFVKLINDKAEAKTATLQVTGTGVSLTPPVAGGAPQAAVSPSDIVDPSTALLIDNAANVVPANGTIWYRFPYDGTRDQVILKLLKGSENDLRMHIHAPSQMSNWWSSDIKPIGQGTPKDDDLVWSGNSNEAGWWYVEIMNDNATPVRFVLESEYVEKVNQPH